MQRGNGMSLMDLSPLRLDTLCFDILVEVAHALEVEDLLNLSLCSKSLYTALCCTEIQNHWLRQLPPAFLPIAQHPKTSPEAKQVQQAVQRLRSLRNKWFSTAESPVTVKRPVTFEPSRHFIHPSGTRWLFSAQMADSDARLRVYDLMTGNLVGESILANQNMYSRLLSAQRHGYNRILLAYVQELRDDRDSTWDIQLITVDFVLSQNKIEAKFSPFKTFRIPSKIASLFIRFDVLQMEGDIIVLSGNWGSKRFLLVNWNTGEITTQSCPQPWRTFDWKLLNSSLVVLYDNKEVHIIPMSKVFDPDRSDEANTSFTKLFVLPQYRDVLFVRADSKTTSAIAIVQEDSQGTRPTISDTRITAADGSTVAISKGCLDGMELDPCFLKSDTAPIYLGSSIASLVDAKTLLIWSIGGNIPWKKLLRFERNILEILYVDSEIGMILVKETVDEGNAPVLRAYWIA